MYETKNWNALVFQGVGSKHQVKPLPVTEDTATVVDIRRRERDDDGEGYEGDWGTCYVIFQVGDRFFRKSFSESSFNENDLWWNDDIEEVQGEVTTTTVFKLKG